MYTSKRLIPIKKLAEFHQQRAAHWLAQSQHQLLGYQQRLTELQHYREEYFVRFREATRSGLGGSRLLEYQQFLSQLNGAIEQLEAAIVNCQRQVEACRRQWRHRYTRIQSLDKAIERFRDSERRQTVHREQIELDEHSQRLKLRSQG